MTELCFICACSVILWSIYCCRFDPRKYRDRSWSPIFTLGTKWLSHVNFDALKSWTPYKIRHLCKYKSSLQLTYLPVGLEIYDRQWLLCLKYHHLILNHQIQYGFRCQQRFIAISYMKKYIGVGTLMLFFKVKDTVNRKDDIKDSKYHWKCLEPKYCFKKAFHLKTSACVYYEYLFFPFLLLICKYNWCKKQ